MFRRNYSVLTDEDVQEHIEKLKAFDAMRRQRKDDSFYVTYAEAEREANKELDDSTRKIWIAQQIIKEKKHFIEIQKDYNEGHFLEKDYIKKYKWLLNKDIIKKVMSHKEDENLEL